MLFSWKRLLLSSDSEKWMLLIFNFNNLQEKTLYRFHKKQETEKDIFHKKCSLFAIFLNLLKKRLNLPRILQFLLFHERKIVCSQKKRTHIQIFTHSIFKSVTKVTYSRWPTALFVYWIYLKNIFTPTYNGIGI